MGTNDHRKGAPAPKPTGESLGLIGGPGIASTVGAAFKRPGMDDSMKASMPYFKEDRQRLGQLMGNRSPFAGREWNGLVSQLQAQASGKGPSMAGMAYNKAAQDSQAALGGMARGSSNPNAARTAMMQQGRIGQGMAAGYAQARAGEMQGAQSALSQALSSRDGINSGAYMGVLGAQLGLSEAQLRAQLGNQSYDAAKSAQPSDAERYMGMLSGGSAGIAKLMYPPAAAVPAK